MLRVNSSKNKEEVNLNLTNDQYYFLILEFKNCTNSYDFFTVNLILPTNRDNNLNKLFDGEFMNDMMGHMRISSL